MNDIPLYARDNIAKPEYSIKDLQFLEAIKKRHKGELLMYMPCGDRYRDIQARPFPCRGCKMKTLCREWWAANFERLPNKHTPFMVWYRKSHHKEVSAIARKKIKQGMEPKAVQKITGANIDTIYLLRKRMKEKK